MNIRSGLAGLALLAAASGYNATLDLNVRTGRFDGNIEMEAPKLVRRIPLVNDVLTPRGDINGTYHGDTINVHLTGGVLGFNKKYHIQFVSANTVQQAPYLENKDIRAKIVYTRRDEKHPARDSTVAGHFFDRDSTILATFYARHWPNETFTGYIRYTRPVIDSVPVFGTFVPDSLFKK